MPDAFNVRQEISVGLLATIRNKIEDTAGNDLEGGTGISEDSTDQFKLLHIV